MSSLHRRILDGFTHTQYWADLGPKTRQRMIDVVTQGRLLLPPQGVRWLSRIFNRGMTLLSIDPPVTALVSLPLAKKGANTYTTSFKDVDAGPRELWLELNSSSFVDVGAPVEPGVYALEDKDLLPGSVANFNNKTITLVSNKEVRSLSTVASGGRQFNKWRQRRNKILQHYSQDRVLADFNFFASKENRGQMMEVMKNLREAAVRNKILARALESLSFTKNGLDMPATAFGGTAGPGNCVYDTLNDLMKLVSELEQLPQGTPIAPMSGDRKWVMLDTKGSKVEASFMRHCLAGETEVITDKGLFQIKDLTGGYATVLTLHPTDNRGFWTPAKFSAYGTHPLKKVSLQRGAETEQFFATSAHRWPVMSDAGYLTELTTDTLFVGAQIPSVTHGAQTLSPWMVVGVESTDRVEEVYCAEVPETHLFTLKGNVVSHNCGNSGGVEGDRLVSFRVPSKSIEGLHEPKLTFIYRPADKTMGEMKGFANNKPDESFHEAIVELFSKPGFVHHIRGEGYMAQNNFSLNDLSAKNLEKLYKANPELVVNMLDHGDNYQRLNSQSISGLEKLLGHPIRPSAPAKPAKKPKKISNDDET